MRIINGNAGIYNALSFGEKSQSTLNYLQNQFEFLPQMVTAAGQAFIQRSKEVFESFNSSEAIRKAKAAIRTVQHIFQSDSIRPLQTLGEMQQAPLSMQRWIMACPEVREEYIKHRCEGYSDTYADYNPGVVGPDHNDWRIVNTGIFQEEDEDGEYKYTCYDTDNEDDPVLTLGEKGDILSTWDLIKHMMKPGKEDPTSPYCNKL